MGHTWELGEKNRHKIQGKKNQLRPRLENVCSSHSQKGSTDPSWDSQRIGTMGPRQDAGQNESSQWVLLASSGFPSRASESDDSTGWKDRGRYKSICSRRQKGLLVSANGNEVSSRKTHPCDLYLDWPIMTGWLEAHGVLLPAGTADISLAYLWLWGTAVQCS